MAGKVHAFHSTYTLLLRSADEEIVTGFTTGRDLASAQRVAMSALRLDARIAYADIHPFARCVAELGSPETAVRITLDSELEESEC